jgi:hypothetical protein
VSFADKFRSSGSDIVCAPRDPTLGIADVLKRDGGRESDGPNADVLKRDGGRESDPMSEIGSEGRDAGIMRCLDGGRDIPGNNIGETGRDTVDVAVCGRLSGRARNRLSVFLVSM